MRVVGREGSEEMEEEEEEREEGRGEREEAKMTISPDDLSWTWSCPCPLRHPSTEPHGIQSQHDNRVSMINQP